jgi:hypothetical protein
MRREVQLDVGTRAVVVVGKPARRGRAKTRLAGDVGEAHAAGLYTAFLEDIAARVAGFCGTETTPVLAWKDDPEHPSYAPFAEAGFAYVEQPSGDLGDCMFGLADLLFEAGADQVMIIGTDSPTLLERHFEAVFDQLAAGADIVLGPSFDGGYYTIGLSGPHEAVFRGIDWSTGAVFGQTSRAAREANLLCELTEFWYDIDTLGDLKKMRAHLFDYLIYRYPDVASQTRKYLESTPEGVFDD